MAKGYWIARIDVRDEEGYKDYIATAGTAFKEYGARFVVRGGRYRAAEGPERKRNVVIEFESYDKALACYNSPSYQEAMTIRKAVSDGELLIVEGYDGA